MAGCEQQPKPLALPPPARDIPEAHLTHSLPVRDGTVYTIVQPYPYSSRLDRVCLLYVGNSGQSSSIACPDS